MFNHNAQMNMVKQQLRTGNVLNESILDLYQSLSRTAFVPAAMRDFAYSDLQIQLPYGQRMLTPLEEGLILQALKLQGHETILEIGTGTGYLTALLSRLSKKVISVDYFEPFTSDAKRHLEQAGCDNVELLTGDACQGWPELAPYDVIIMTGAMEKLDSNLQQQLAAKGQLIAIIGQNPIMHCLHYQLNEQGDWNSNLLFETNIPLLIDKTRRSPFVF